MCVPGEVYGAVPYKILPGRFELVRRPSSIRDKAGRLDTPDTPVSVRLEVYTRAATFVSAATAAKHNLPMKKSILRSGANRVLHLLCRFLPGATGLRPFLHRLRGVRIEGRVFIGDDVYIENEYPECVEIQDGVQIGLRTTIVAHTRGCGKVVIGKNAFVGANCVIVTSSERTLTIGEGSVLTATSFVTDDVQPYTLYSSERAKPLAKVTRAFTAETSYDEFIRGLQPLLSKDQRRG